MIVSWVLLIVSPAPPYSIHSCLHSGELVKLSCPQIDPFKEKEGDETQCQVYIYHHYCK